MVIKRGTFFFNSTEITILLYMDDYHLPYIALVFFIRGGGIGYERNPESRGVHHC